MRIPSRRILAAAVVTTSLILAGCSSGSDDDSTTTGSSASSTADSSSGSSSGASEVTIQHVWGEATYPTKPAKVISIGTATDNLLALGIVPDAIVERPDDKDAVWKNDQLEGVERIGLSDRDMPIEAIAKLEPDLIVGDLYRINEDQYKTLKDIAPTLPGIDKSVDWAPQLEALAKIYDREDRAREIVEADEKAFADARDRLPGLKGKTALTVQDRSGQFGVIADPENIANRFYSRLGMTLPKPFTDNSVQVNQGRAQISYERVSDLAANFMGIYATEGMDKIHGIAGYDQLPQVSSGAVVQDNKAVMAALNVPSSLSNAWLLEQLGDQLKIAADADPVEAV